MNFAPRREIIHGLVAAKRFPGPNYYEVLSWLQDELQPKTYVEIGVRRGTSLKLAGPPTVALGIDPFPEVENCWATHTHVVPMTSAEFFARHTLEEFVGTNRVSLGFIDGSHRFEDVVDDIFNLERFATPDTLIAVHDTMPLDAETASRERKTVFYTGDVWKVMPFLRQHRPDLELTTVKTGPSGLTLIRQLDPDRTRGTAECDALDRFRDLSWEYYQQHRDDFLKTIPNEREAVTNWLSHRT